MKIIFVGGVDVPGQGGIENYVLNLARALHDNGHECVILCRSDHPGVELISDVEIVKLKVKENQLAILVHNLKAAWWVFKNAKNCDIVNFQSIYFPFFYEWIPKLRGIKVIHTQHSFAQDNPKHGKLSRLFIKFIYFVSAFIFSPVTTVSAQNRDLVKRRLRKDAKVIHCGVNMPISSAHTDILQRYNIKNGKYYLSIGRIDPVKNLDVLIKAFLRHPQTSEVQLVIAGNWRNKYGTVLRELAKDDNRVVFVGPVYGEDKATLLYNCMAYGLVSSSEGFPIALLEAMSYGKVCLCSNIPANKEALTDELGLWSEAKDAHSLYRCMHELESQPKKLEIKGTLARKRVEKLFTWNKVALVYEEYLNSLGVN